MLILQDHSSTTRNAWHLFHYHFNHVDLGSVLGAREDPQLADEGRYLGEHGALCHDLLVWVGAIYCDGEAIFNLLEGLPCTEMQTTFKLVLQSSACSSVSTTFPSTLAFASTATSTVSGSSVSTLTTLCLRMFWYIMLLWRLVASQWRCQWPCYWLGVSCQHCQCGSTCTDSINPAMAPQPQRRRRR